MPTADNSTVGTVKFSFVKGRMAFSANQSLAANSSEAGPLELGNAADGTDAVPRYTFPALNPDIILGTMYQSNGSADDGSTWCNNGDANAATAFQITLSASEDKYL